MRRMVIMIFRKLSCRYVAEKAWMSSPAVTSTTAAASTMASSVTFVRKLSTLKMIWKIATTPNIQISAWLSSPVSDIVTPTAIQVLLHYLSSIFSILSTPHCNVESVALKEKSSPW